MMMISKSDASRSVLHSLDSVDFGIYIHWPFCAAKCPYCDFNSHVRHHAIDQNRYLKAYQKEIAHMATRTPHRTVRSIFFGGGTPSLMAPKIVCGILDAIYEHWPVVPHIEISLEANPQSVDSARFSAYQKLGINRLSLGVQALNNSDLRMLGRRHSVEEAIAAIHLAQKIFPQISFDLIYARPHQTVEAWTDELEYALELSGHHLSLYQLTIEPDTRFFDLHKAGRLTVPSPDEAATFYEVTQDICEQAGMPAYEISNHAKVGHESQHNLIYWRYGEYAGVGPGAHSRIIKDDASMRMAIATERNPEHWLELVETRGHGITVEESLSPEEQGDEFLLMGLRLKEGIDLNRYEALSGRSIDQDRINKLIDHGLMERVVSPKLNNQVRITPAGIKVLNAVITEIAA